MRIAVRDLRKPACFCKIIFSLLSLLFLSAARYARASDAIGVTPKTSTPGQTVTMKWYFTGSKIVVSGGRFGKGTDVTGKITLTDAPQKTTRYTFDVWYPNPASTSVPKALVHVQYFATAEVGDADKEPTEEQLAHQILVLLNAERALNSLPPLHLLAQLQIAAHWMAQDMSTNDYLDHTDHQGRELEDRLASFQYRDYQAIGENVAAGQATAAEVMAEWLNSPGHRANILSPDYCELGIGHAVSSTSKYRHFWTQDFGRLLDSYPVVINTGCALTMTPIVRLYLYGAASMKEVRLSNDGLVWTMWEAYQADREWTLAAGSGKRTVYVEMKDGKRTYRSQETIELAEVKPAPSRVAPTRYSGGFAGHP